MSEFAEAAKAEAAVTIPEVTTQDEVLASFLSGQNSVSGILTSIDGVLSEGKTVLARRTKTGSVLLPPSVNASVAVNDKLIGALAISQAKYRRLASFDNLLNSAHRVADVDEGRFEDFAAAADMFSFEYTQAELDSIALAKSFRSRISTFFGALQREEERKRAAAAEKAAKEMAEREAIDWDTGNGNQTNHSVHGAGGGGARLRLRQRKERYPRVETSTGYELTLKQTQTAWEFATRYWHGGQPFQWSDYASKELHSGSYSSRRMTVYKDRIEVGCQTVYRKEAERFAATQGWTFAAPKSA